MAIAFSDLLTHDMRLVMLRSMLEQGNTINESILQSVLEALGHKVSRDRVRTEMRWLEEQKLVNIESVVGILVAELTGRGVDCALGRCKVDGVKMPRPKE
jgi:repressor of nif and glnA expression